MNERILKRAGIALTALCVCTMGFCAVFSALKIETAEAIASISKEDATSQLLGNMRYGYNVTAGKAIYDDALCTSGAILKPIEEGLYQYIQMDERSTQTAENYMAYSAVGVAEQSGLTVSGGISGKISAVNLDIGASFDTTNSLSTTYSERYEFYYTKIINKSYIIQLGTAELRDYVTDSFLSEMRSVSDAKSAQTALKKYGTHLFTGFQYGGLMYITNYQVASDSSVSLSSRTDLKTKIGVATAAASGGVNFSFSEQYTQQETSSNCESKYSFKSFGGEAVEALTMDQLFTYNSSIADGKGNYIYGRWINSINEGKNLALLGTPSSAQAIPVWELLPSTSEYASVRQILANTYKTMCGDKYAEYCEQYPTTAREIISSDESAGTVSVLGYSEENSNGYVTYKDTSNDASVEYTVLPGSKISINFTDSVSAGKKCWKITSGTDVAITDSVNGVVTVNKNAIAGATFTVQLYSDTTPVGSAMEFTVQKKVFSGGGGTESSPYLLATKDDLLSLQRNWSTYREKYFKLVSDIDMQSSSLLFGNDSSPFSGTFDGNYYTVKNINISSDSTAAGIFAYNEGTIKNLFVDTVKINSENTNISYIGGLVGSNSGTVNNCNVAGADISVTNTSQSGVTLYVGGLIGKNSGTVSECCVSGATQVSGAATDDGKKDTNYSYVGGLIGYSSASIENCYVDDVEKVYSNVKANKAYSYSGGLIGYAKSADDNATINIKNCVVGQLTSVAAEADSNIWLFFGGEKDSATRIIIAKGGTVKAENIYYVNMNGVSAGIDGCNSFNSRSDMKYSSCDKLSSLYWCAGNENFPVLAKQVLKSVSINTDNAKKEFVIGEEFTLIGVSVTAVTSGDNADSFTVDVLKYDASSYNKDEAGVYKITVTALGQNKEFEVTVRKNKIVGINATAKNSLHVGDSVSIDDFDIYYVLEDGTEIAYKELNNPTKQGDYSGYVEIPSNLDIAVTADSGNICLGDNKITFALKSDSSVSGSLIVTAEENPVDSIKITTNPTKMVYDIGERFDYTGMVVLVTYKNGETAVIEGSDLADLEIIGSEIYEGENDVIVSYADYKTATVTVSGVEGGSTNETNGGFPVWIPIVAGCAAVAVVVVIVIVKKRS